MLETDYLNSDLGRDVKKLLWDDILYKNLLFQSLDAYLVVTSGSGSATADFSYLEMSTGATSGSNVRVGKMPTGFAKLTGFGANAVPLFDHECRFQTAFELTADTNQEIELVWGQAKFGTQAKFGISVVNDTINVRTADGAAANDVAITTFTATAHFEAVARLYPGNKVVVRLEDLDTQDAYSAESTSNIPTGTSQAHRIFHANIKNTAAADKVIRIPSYEFMVDRWGK